MFQGYASNPATSIKSTFRNHDAYHILHWPLFYFYLTLGRGSSSKARLTGISAVPSFLNTSLQNRKCFVVAPLNVYLRKNKLLHFLAIEIRQMKQTAMCFNFQVTLTSKQLTIRPQIFYSKGGVLRSEMSSNIWQKQTWYQKYISECIRFVKTRFADT